MIKDTTHSRYLQLRTLTGHWCEGYWASLCHPICNL